MCKQDIKAHKISYENVEKSKAKTSFSPVTICT